MKIDDVKLTVFTPTYNRSYSLPHLYQSLLRQSNYNFEWLVVDDGSTDDTKQLFEIWMESSNPFPIRYYRQDNQGLNRAFNRGIELAQGKYLSKIDSDDYVVDDYCETILQWLEEIQNKPDVYGVAGLRVTPNNIPLKGVQPSIPEDTGYVDATDLERSIYNLDADMSEAWEVGILRKHPFPVWENEKFAPEQITFYDIALEGKKIRWFPKALVICEYREDGLTKGARTLERQNPMGYAMMYNQRLKYEKSFFSRFYCACQMNALSIIGGHSEYLKRSNDVWISILAAVPGWILSIRRKKQYLEK